jgi:peptidoglycan/LPS O-acetylase OafA/YrhL
MRGVAVLLVLSGHVLFLTHPEDSFSATVGRWNAAWGLVIFFTVSGFLLYRPFLAARGGDRTVASITPRYLFRRAVRILPAYWVALTVLAIFPGVNGAFGPHWWVDYGLLQVYAQSWAGTGLGVAWTLCVELSFYLLLPLLALFLQSRGAGSGNRRGLRWELVTLGSLATASLVFAALVGGNAQLSYLAFTLLGNFQWFFLGMFLAVVELGAPGALAASRWFLRRPALCWPAVALALAALLLGLPQETGLSNTFVDILDNLAVAVLAIGLMGPAVLDDARPLNRAIFANRALLFVGTVSYGIYLWHLPILEKIINSSLYGGWRFPVATTALLALVSAVSLGAASWYLIEKPLMSRARMVKALRRSRDSEPDPSPPPPPAGQLEVTG